MDEGLSAGGWIGIILANITAIIAAIYFFRLLFRYHSFLNRPPSVPSIENEVAVVDWFLKYDNNTRNLRTNFKPMLEQIKQDILTDLRNNADESSLKQFVQGAMKFWEDTAFPQAALRLQTGHPTEGETQEDWIKIIYAEQYLAAKIRVLGYFLLKKYGIQMS